MSAAPASDSSAAASASAKGRRVTAETLSVAPAVVGQPLAEPWRRLAAMLVDLAVIGALSWLTAPVLGLATGAMLVVLFGNSATAPLPLKAVRWACRGIGAVIILFAALSLGHSSLVRDRGLNLEAFIARGESSAMKRNVFIEPNATPSQIRDAAAQLEQQVTELKREVRAQRETNASWTGQARGFAGALGVTFGWSGVYFTLVAGAFSGRSLGKLLLGIRAARITGQPMTFFDAFVRHGGYVAGVAMGLTGFLKLLWDANRQAVEDRIAGTVVVRA